MHRIDWNHLPVPMVYKLHPRAGLMSRNPAFTRRRGFTLIEIMVVVALIGVGSALAAWVLINFQSQNRTRHAVRAFMGAINQTRSQASILGTAPAENRVNAAACPASFVDPTGVLRPSIEIDPVNMTVTYVDTVVTDTNTNPPFTYIMNCRTDDFGAEFHDSFVIDGGRTTLPAAGGRYVLNFDSRGFATNMGANVAMLSVREAEGRQMEQRVLVLGSGFACIEGSVAGQCARSR